MYLCIMIMCVFMLLQALIMCIKMYIQYGKNCFTTTYRMEK